MATMPDSMMYGQSPWLLAAIVDDGFDAWLGNALGSPMMGDRAGLRAMVERGLAELKRLHEACGVK